MQSHFEGGEDVTEELHGMLSRWLFNHIRNEDHGYVDSAKAYLRDGWRPAVGARATQGRGAAWRRWRRSNRPRRAGWRASWGSEPASCARRIRTRRAMPLQARWQSGPAPRRWRPRHRGAAAPARCGRARPATGRCARAGTARRGDSASSTLRRSVTICARQQVPASASRRR